MSFILSALRGLVSQRVGLVSLASAEHVSCHSSPKSYDFRQEELAMAYFAFCELILSY